MDLEQATRILTPTRPSGSTTPALPSDTSQTSTITKASISKPSKEPYRLPGVSRPLNVTEDDPIMTQSSPPDQLPKPKATKNRETIDIISLPSDGDSSDVDLPSPSKLFASLPHANREIRTGDRRQETSRSVDIIQDLAPTSKRNLDIHTDIYRNGSESPKARKKPKLTDEEKAARLAERAARKSKAELEKEAEKERKRKEKVSIPSYS